MNPDRGSVCRLLVVGPTSQVDVSVPTHIPLADMMPALLGALGPDLADRGLEHSGWLAQRLGEAALDESRTVGDLGLLDGEVVHVRPRTDQIPPLAYDDLIAGVSAGIRDRAGLWRPETTRLAAVLLTAGWLAAGLAVLRGWLDTPGKPVERPVGLAMAALVCLVAGVVVARRAGDRALAAILGVAAVAGALLSTVDAAGTAWGTLGTPRAMLATAVVTATVALLVAAFVFPRAHVRPIGAGLLGVVLLLGVAAGLRAEGTLDWTGVAAVVVGLTTALRPAVPTAAFKLAGFSLPEVPAESDDLQTGIDPRPAAEILAGTAVADRFMTALYAALGLVAGTAMVFLAVAPGWAAPLAAGLAGAAQTLVTRPMTSTWHRLALAGPVLVAMVAWCLTAVADRGDTAAVAAVVCCLVLTAAAGVAARIAPRRRFTPLLGRVGDVAHTVTVVALVPTVVIITGLVDLIRTRVG